jgi:hypothetical protein
LFVAAGLVRDGRFPAGISASVLLAPRNTRRDENDPFGGVAQAKL